MLGELGDILENSNSTVTEKMSGISLLLLPTVFIATIFSSLGIYPIFLYVKRQNQEADKQTAVYPILNHFHKIVTRIFAVTLFLIVFYIGLTFLFALVKINLPEHLNTVFWLPNRILSAVYLFLTAIPQVQYILHFLLALQRFLIYFNPDKDSYLKWTKWRFRVVLITIYSFFLIKDVLFQILPTSNESVIEGLLIFQVVITVVLNLLLIISALLYIPIMISVLKLTNLASAIEHKPQIYIFCQIVTHLVTRIIFLQLLLYVTFHNLPALVYFNMLIDIFSTPLTIQVAYLLCNRKNVQTLLSLTWLTFIRTLFCPSYRQATVRPRVDIESTRN